MVELSQHQDGGSRWFNVFCASTCWQHQAFQPARSSLEPPQWPPESDQNPSAQEGFWWSQTPRWRLAHLNPLDQLECHRNLPAPAASPHRCSTSTPHPPRGRQHPTSSPRPGAPPHCRRWGCQPNPKRSRAVHVQRTESRQPQRETTMVGIWKMVPFASVWC